MKPKNHKHPPAVIEKPTPVAKRNTPTAAKFNSTFDLAVANLRTHPAAVHAIIDSGLIESRNEVLAKMNFFRNVLMSATEAPARLYNQPFRHGSFFRTREEEQLVIAMAFCGFAEALQDFFGEVEKASAARDAEIPPDVLKRLRDERRC